MHATIEQLLAIRDREPVAATLKQHVDLCLWCRERLDQFALARNQLNHLPEHSPWCDYWPDILARHEQARQSQQHRRKLARYGGLGLAASALLASILFVYQANDADHGKVTENTPVVVLNDTAAPAVIIAGENVPQSEQLAPDITSTEAELDTLIVHSARLEAVLHALPERPRVTRAGTSDLITELQDSVALLDYQLIVNTAELPEQASRQLWQQRVDLMNSLVNVRYAEAQQVAYTPN